MVKIQQLVPIVCVDILPIERSPSDEISRIGLIKGHTPHEGDKQCTVGGRLLFDESLQEGFGDSCGIRKNEALDFQWCTLSEFRMNEHIGFGQERVIEMCLERFEGLNKLR